MSNEMHICTAQQQADYWAWQVQIGRGQWESRLCLRGLGDMGLILPPSAYLGLIVPEPFEMYDEARQIIFGAARIREAK